MLQVLHLRCGQQSVLLLGHAAAPPEEGGNGGSSLAAYVGVSSDLMTLPLAARQVWGAMREN